MSNTPPDRPEVQDAKTDPLAGLYKMSRTAGLGAQDYVAVNATAVIALLLGLASSLSVVGSLLLIIPVIAIVVGVVAIRQVRHSAGTQTGIGLAILGILLALLFAGIKGGKEFNAYRMVQQEKDQIIALIDQVGKDVKNENYNAAWTHFSDRFKHGVSKDDFDAFWIRTKLPEFGGPVTGMRWNGILQVDIDPETGSRTAAGVVLIDLSTRNANGERVYARVPTTFRKVSGQWMIDSLQIGFGQGPR
jgi:hypothetical protein